MFHEIKRMSTFHIFIFNSGVAAVRRLLKGTENNTLVKQKPGKTLSCTRSQIMHTYTRHTQKSATAALCSHHCNNTTTGWAEQRLSQAEPGSERSSLHTHLSASEETTELNLSEHRGAASGKKTSDSPTLSLSCTNTHKHTRKHNKAL